MLHSISHLHSISIRKCEECHGQFTYSKESFAWSVINTSSLKLECWFSRTCCNIFYHVMSVGTDPVYTWLFMHFHSKMLSVCCLCAWTDYIHTPISWSWRHFFEPRFWEAEGISIFPIQAVGIWRALISACVYFNLVSYLSYVDLISHSCSLLYEWKVAEVGWDSQDFRALPWQCCMFQSHPQNTPMLGKLFIAFLDRRALCHLFQSGQENFVQYSFFQASLGIFMTTCNFLRFFSLSLFCLAVLLAFDRGMFLLWLGFFSSECQFCLLSQFVLCEWKHLMKIVYISAQIFQQLVPELDSVLQGCKACGCKNSEEWE